MFIALSKTNMALLSERNVLTGRVGYKHIAPPEQKRSITVWID